MRRHLPAEPLLRAWERTGGTLPVDDRQALRRQYWRASFSGRLTLDAADQLAVELIGVHPCELWPEWFEVCAGD